MLCKESFQAYGREQGQYTTKDVYKDALYYKDVYSKDVGYKGAEYKDLYQRQDTYKDAAFTKDAGCTKVR